MVDFDIYEWLESKGIGVNFGKNDNKQIAINSLEDFFSVPKLADINEFGEVIIKFSSPIIKIEYDEITAKFIIFGRKLRILADDDTEET